MSLSQNICAVFFTVIAVYSVAAAQENPTQLLWGDTHIHTSFSLDAYALANRSADPDTAFRYAKGYPVVHPYTKARIQINTPLDFLVVSDHAEYMGAILRLYERDPIIADTPAGRRLLSLIDQGRDRDAIWALINSIKDNAPLQGLYSDTLRQTVWQEIVDTAERHNEPGAFTALSGWEWSSAPDAANLHRVVFTPAAGDIAKQFLPYSALDSMRPEDLWAWLDKTSAALNIDFVAIPHNSNLSKGRMFSLYDFDGAPISAGYARLRMRWEPVIETTQIKGDSETHAALSPNDEFADFETFVHLLEINATRAVPDAGDYARTALMRGLKIGASTGVNPYKFGLSGATDSHTSMASAEENNFWGKFPRDSTPENSRDLTVTPGAKGWDMSAAGYTGVWATENTRQAITQAFKRKEVYATTGPRIALRFFVGWKFKPHHANAKNIAAIGYKKGVPMGADLTAAPAGKAPSFLIHAVKDPKGANLDRIQIVKGWLDANGATHEKIYDVAGADGRIVDARGKLPPVGNSVNLKTGAYTNDIGDAQLATTWTDPAFNAAQSAFYYVRVLQIPTPRHSLLDAIALQMDVEETGKPPTIQERAYSSPIWYTP
jgi:Protein of unknown function (DUF3604)